MKKVKIDLISLIAILMIILSSIFLTGYYFMSRMNQCVNDPLNFYIDRIKKTTNAEGIVGEISLMKNGRAMVFQSFGDYDFESNQSFNMFIESPYKINIEK